ncbi:hypothetical protein GGS20DRAFT_111992 [Poronia punctata]|nr:hypothetical protein GGS20DRAFT_111992 [Poronia punctata]
MAEAKTAELAAGPPIKQHDEPMISERVAHPEATADASETGPQSRCIGDEPAAEPKAGGYAAMGTDVQQDAKKKKKKKSKRTPKSRRNITGFEEFYADAPTTPAEALRKKELYSV